MKTIEAVVVEYLKQSQLNIPRAEMVELIQTHPNYPSLVSVADALDSLGIDNTIAKVDNADLKELPYPYLLHNNNTSSFDIISNFSNLENIKFNTNTQSIVLKANKFRIPLSEQQISAIKTAKGVFIIKNLVFIVLITLLGWAGFHLHDWQSIIFYSFALSGLSVGVLLVFKNLGLNSKLVDDLCGVDKSRGCNQVLKNDPISILGLFNLTDATISYFSWQCLLFILPLLAPSLQKDMLTNVSIVSSFSIIAVLFSIYQQLSIKDWCKLCLIIDVILVAQFILSIYIFLTKTEFSLTVFTLTLFALLFICCLITLIRNHIHDYFSLKKSITSLNRNKYSLEYFKYTLENQPIADTTELEREISIGDTQAPIDIIMVSNLYCNPCSKAHNDLNRLIQLFPGKVRIRFRFINLIPPIKVPMTANLYLIQFWLRKIYNKPNQEFKTATLLHDWYKNMSLTDFLHDYSTEFDEDDILTHRTVDEQQQWIARHGVQATPAFFVNGHQLPSNIKIRDIKILIPSLAESYEIGL